MKASRHITARIVLLVALFAISLGNSLLAEGAAPGISEQLPGIPKADVKAWIESQGGNWCATQDHWNVKMAKANLDPNACPTEGPCDNPATRDTYIPNSNTPVTSLRIHFNVFANNDGSNPAANLAKIDAQVQTLNAHFAPLKIRWTYTYTFINNSTYRSFADAEEIGMKNLYAVKPDSQLNVYVTNIEGSYIGVGTFPWDPDALTKFGGIVIDDNYFGGGEGTLTHEVGHCVGLWHTHHGVSEVAQCGQCYERADNLNGNTTGDFCDDTDPTPTNYNCAGPGGSNVCSGAAWGPTDPQNFMGYAPDFCYTEFSPQQWGRIHCWVNDNLNGWRNCSPALATKSPMVDGDLDGVDDASDNCVGVFNPCQENADGDGLGDACDPDMDNDGIANASDNCPMTSNASQQDSDGDGRGNVCDNCVSVVNTSQADLDGDGAGDACDVCTDTDSDGFADPGYPASTCPIDNCPSVANGTQADNDADGVGNTCDNCVNTPNPPQFDENQDGIGDACDGFLHIQSYTLPEGYLGVPYSFQFTAVGGVPPYNWTLFGGDVPFGTNFNGGAVGTLTGVPSFASTYFFTVICVDAGGPQKADTIALRVRVTTPPEPNFLCGDADGSTFVSVSDAVYLINFIFGGGPAPDPLESGDADCNTFISIADAVYLINYIFSGGAAPCASCP